MTKYNSAFLGCSLSDNMTVIQGKIGDSDDFVYRDFSAIGHDFVCLTMENLVDKEQLERQVIEKILAAKALPSDGLPVHRQFYAGLHPLVF